MDGSLRVKRRTVVLRGQQKSFNSNEKFEEEQVASPNHITIHECDDSYSEIGLAETPETLKDRGHAIVDDLKELNLGTNEEPRPIYMISLLIQEEEKEHFDLLSEYKDLFAWMYKEMPKLDPKSQSTTYLSKKVFHLRSSPNDTFAQS